ncbi:MAG: hypothetical protein QM733_19145 [Ilumatobacteraceae bacterium]
MVIDVSAVAVVDGATVVIARPVIVASVGASAVRSRSWCQPSPSSTSSTTWRASATSAGIHDGRAACDGASSAGIRPRTFGPA